MPSHGGKIVASRETPKLQCRFNMVNVSDTILDRISKLMNMAERGDGPEAELASQRAAEMMAKHQIEAADIQARRGISDVPTIVKGRIDNEESAPRALRHNVWKSMLAHVVAIGMGGKMWRSTFIDKTHKVMMFGTPDAIASARYLYMALERQLERMVRRYLRETGGRGPQGNAFLQGAVARIGQRFAEGREAAMTTASSMALTIVNRTDAAITQHYESLGELKHAKTQPTRDIYASMAGYDAADTLDLGTKKEQITEGLKKLK